MTLNIHSSCHQIEFDVRTKIVSGTSWQVFKDDSTLIANGAFLEVTFLDLGIRVVMDPDRILCVEDVAQVRSYALKAILQNLTEDKLIVLFERMASNIKEATVFGEQKGAHKARLKIHEALGIFNF